MSFIGEPVSTSPGHALTWARPEWKFVLAGESRRRTWRRAVLALAALAAALTLGAAAHDIPTDVRINAFVKPEGNRLELLIRVPLAALIEAEFPTRGPGYIDIS